MRITTVAALALAACLLAATASAEILHYTAKLTGAAETPPNASKGVGVADVTLDTGTHMLNWKIVYSGLTGPATMTHFHGPAAPGVAAGVAVAVGGPQASPIIGTAAVNYGQIGDLRGGLWYLNIHSAKYPKGEIRGQVVTPR